MQIATRDITSGHATERYVTAIPDPSADPAAEARRLFEAIREEASRCNGRLCAVRVFVPDGAKAAYRDAWQTNGLCTWLKAGPGAAGGVQAHIVAGPFAWRPIVDDDGRQAGWTFANEHVRWAVGVGLETPRTDDDIDSTVTSFETAERLIAQADMRLTDVARTWFFLDDILAWYDRFNVGRNQVFAQRGLIAPPAAGGPSSGVPRPALPGRDTGTHGRARPAVAHERGETQAPSPTTGTHGRARPAVAHMPEVPASTGIGVSPACDSSRLAMEFFAVAGEDECIVRRPAAGRQRCAYEYGSAFARVAEAITPAGRTVFVSGTAAIDQEGRTCFVDDPDGQIRMTLENVVAVLDGAGARPADVVQAIAYCKTPAIAARFAEAFRHTQPWPWLTVVGDVCRPDLLFEAEVTARRPPAP